MSSRYNFCSVRTSFYAYLRNNELPLMDKLRACALQSIPGLFSKGLGTRLIKSAVTTHTHTHTHAHTHTRVHTHTHTHLLLPLFCIHIKWCRPLVPIHYLALLIFLFGFASQYLECIVIPCLWKASSQKAHLSITMAILLCLCLTWLTSPALVCPTKTHPGSSHFQSSAAG